MSATYYQPTGRISIFGVVGGLAVGTAAACVLGVVYAAALVYIPVVQIAFLLPFGYGAGTAAITVAIARGLKLRNRWVAAGIAVATTGIGYFFSWLPWAYFTLSNAGADILFTELLDPFAFIGLLGMIYQEGAWSIGSSGTPVSGIMLGVCWIAEMGIVLGLAGVVGYARGAAGVFCEGCDSWCAEVPSLLRFTSHAEAELVRRLKVRDLTALGQMPAAGFGETPWVDVKLCHCVGCGHTNTVFVERCTTTRDHRGNAITHRVPLVAHLLVRRDEVAWLRSLTHR